MKTPPSLLILACLPLGSLVSAQSVASSATSNQAAVTTDLTVKLNPFVISVDTDDGYAPSETLSGTRLKAQVKDIPSAISIISADMLSDLGALNFKNPSRIRSP